MVHTAVLAHKKTTRRTVTLTTDLRAADLVAVLNAGEATENNGSFIGLQESLATAASDVSDTLLDKWFVVSTDEPPAPDADGSCCGCGGCAVEAAKAGDADADPETKAAEQAAAQRKNLLSKVNALTIWAFEANTNGVYSLARQLATAASAYNALAGGGDSSEAVMLLSQKSFNCSSEGQHGTAWRYGRQAIAMAARVHGIDGVMYALTINNIAEGLIDAGRFELAEKYLTHGVALMTKAKLDESVDAAWIKDSLADAHRNLRRLLTMTGRKEAADLLID